MSITLVAPVKNSYVYIKDIYWFRDGACLGAICFDPVWIKDPNRRKFAAYRPNRLGSGWKAPCGVCGTYYKLGYKCPEDIMFSREKFYERLKEGWRSRHL